jgi:transcriptional regulator with XRE-family HTH domain
MDNLLVQQTIDSVISKIKEIRKLKGFSHEYIADTLQISVSAYNKIERQETKLTLERLLQIQQILDVPLSKLLDLKAENIYNQDLKDNAVGHISHQEIQNLYQENKENTQNLITAYKEQIAFLRKQLEKN